MTDEQTPPAKETEEYMIYIRAGRDETGSYSVVPLCSSGNGGEA